MAYTHFINTGTKYKKGGPFLCCQLPAGFDSAPFTFLWTVSRHLHSSSPLDKRLTSGFGRCHWVSWVAWVEGEDKKSRVFLCFHDISDMATSSVIPSSMR